MIYKLTFLRQAKKEWDNLDTVTKDILKKKLSERLVYPRVEKDKLTGLKDCYKIKLRSVGYRLVYRVFDDRVVVQVVCIGKRNNNDVYNLAYIRFGSDDF